MTMKKTFIASLVYLVLGLSAGIFYREFTKAQDFPSGEYTQLSVLHTHLLTLGFLVLLLTLVLIKAFGFEDDSRFKPFFWSYNLGVLVTSTIMAIRGVLTIVGDNGEYPAISGIAGLGHVLTAFGLGLLMLMVGTKVFAKPTSTN